MSLPAPAPGAHAVVTGASSGIGEALAEGLARRGHGVVLVARRADRLERLAERLRTEHGVDAEPRGCDLADREQRRELAGELAERRVSVLCNNAGFTTCGHLHANDPAREAEEVEVNALAVHELTLAVLPGMLERRAGALLVTGSTAGLQPVPTAATYSATKAFANAFAEALHGELAGTGVTCTLVAPGPVLTEFYAAGGVPQAASNRLLPWMTAERVAEDALAGLERGRRVVIPGAVAKAQALGGRHTPRALLFPLLRTVVLPMVRRRSPRHEDAPPHAPERPASVRELV